MSEETKLTQDQKLLLQVPTAFKELLEAHLDQVKNCVEESDKRKAKMSLSVVFDYSESEPLVTVNMGMTSKINDKRVVNLGDPNQTEMELPAEEVEKKKKDRKKSAKTAQEEQGD